MADCVSEVVALRHRVCLIFNLIQIRGGKGRAAALTAPDYDPQIALAAALLRETLGRDGATAKIAWLLEHHYSPAGLAFSALKSADAAKARVLAEAAARADCAAHLAIVHIEESGPAEPTYSDYEDRYEDDDEDEDDFETEPDDDDASDDEFEVVEVSESQHYVDHWSDPHDRAVAFGKLPLADGELLPQGALDDEKPDRQKLTEATGNEGASFERSYHRAAVVIWHRARYADMLLQAGVGAALPWLKERIAACANGAVASAARRDAAALARRMIAQWKAGPDLESYSYHDVGRPADRTEMLDLLGRLGDAALVEEFVGAVVTRDYDDSENAALVAHLPLLAPVKLGEIVSEVLRQKMRHHPAGCVELLQGLIPDRNARPTADHAAALRQVAEAAVAALDEVSAHAAASTMVGRIEGLRIFREIDRLLADLEEEDDEPARTPQNRPIDAAFVVNLLTVLGKLEAPAAPALCEAAARKIAARPGVFDPVKVIVPALGVLSSKDRKRGRSGPDAAVEHLWGQSADFLLRRSESPPEPPRYWRQEATLSCRCADCRELQEFARDPVKRVHRFSVRKDRRQHLHRAIEQHGLEMMHVTERKGSPQTLVCTKDRRGYRRRCEQYRHDIAALAALAGVAAEPGAEATAQLQRIGVARARHASWSPRGQ